jgi:hypothetical protein
MKNFNIYFFDRVISSPIIGKEKVAERSNPIKLSPEYDDASTYPTEFGNDITLLSDYV